MPAYLLAGVLVTVVVLFCVIRVLDDRDKGMRKVRLTITLLPPKLEFEVERRSES